MPRDVCEISEDISPGSAVAYSYDAPGRLPYAYDGSGDFLRAHMYQQPGRDKQVAIKVGRYISSDPIGLAGKDLNTFSAVWQNPVNWIDPWGTDGKRAADWALGLVGSGDWGTNSTSPYLSWYHLYGYGMGYPKCNFFVHDALVAGGDAPSLPEGREYPYTAAEWANSGFTIPGYVVVVNPNTIGPLLPGQVWGTPDLGDVVAVGGHVGLYAPINTTPATVSASTRSNKIENNDWAFRKGDREPTIRRCSCDLNK